MTFRAINPVTGDTFGDEILEARESDVSEAIQRARAVAGVFAATSPTQRAIALRSIADAIESKRAILVETACAETGLPEGRIDGEVTRTTVQIKLFAHYVESGDYLKAVIDHADPNYSPAPRPDLRKQNQSLGVVAVFAASNFPLAFSVAGGDSVSALASGNAVVVKAHPSHPNTCAIVAEAVRAGLAKVNLPREIFSIIQGTNPQITHWLALDPHITAIGFTGSSFVGKMLVDIAAKREIPIPVFAEMGSLNPVFVTSSALNDRSEPLAKASVDSALLGSGQFCTKPGLFFIPSGESGNTFLSEVRQYLKTLSVGPLLNRAITDRYTAAISELSNSGKVTVIAGNSNKNGFGVTPTFFITDYATFASNPALLEEHFGPTTVLITANESDYVSIALALEGQLTATIHGTQTDNIAELLNVLASKAGRVIWNGFPTGVAVTTAMQHGGQWPSSSSHTTSVGIDAMYRFMRPVAYQSVSDAVLPPALQSGNPWKIERVVNGVRTKQ